VGVDLVSGVPDEPISAKVKGQMQGQAQLDDAKIAGKVRRPDTQNSNQFVAHFMRKLVQLLVGELVQINWALNARQ
jgi:hypothetical protein